MTLATSIILPVHNQADHLDIVVKGYLDALGRVAGDHEIVLVENGSSDGTLQACHDLAQAGPEVRVVVSSPAGWGRAVRTGLAASRGELLCYTNSARTTPEDLTLLLLYASVHSGVVVKANRRIRESARRRLGSLLYNLECRTLFDLSCWDINGTPKVFPRSFSDLLALTRDDDLLDAEFVMVCRRNDYPMIEVPIFSANRFGGRSTTGYASAARMYVGAFNLWWTSRRRARA